MQVLPKNINEIFSNIKNSNSESYVLKGIFLDNFESMLSEHLDSRYDLQKISSSKFYAYSKKYHIVITLECKYLSEEGVTIVSVEKSWRDEELLKAFFESRNMINYDITDKIGARTPTKELILVRVNEDRHLFSQEEFEAIGYYVVFNKKLV